jgi:hypothetical protein
VARQNLKAKTKKAKKKKHDEEIAQIKVDLARIEEELVEITAKLASWL